MHWKIDGENAIEKKKIPMCKDKLVILSLYGDETFWNLLLLVLWVISEDLIKNKGEDWIENWASAFGVWLYFINPFPVNWIGLVLCGICSSVTETWPCGFGWISQTIEWSDYESKCYDRREAIWFLQPLEVCCWQSHSFSLDCIYGQRLW